MEMDRSFCLKDELEMFLARCPKLASISQFHCLKNKGDMLTEEELINGVVQLFLHPRYTIPLVGCFRRIARKIVDRAVALLRLVPDLTSNSEDSMVEFDEERLFKEGEDPGIVCVIDFYVVGGRGLDLHEISCLAFSRALDLVPFLLGSVLYYFEFAPPPFKRIVEKDSVAKSSFLAGSQLLSLRVSYRLLLAEPEVFNRQWDWSCILVFVQQLTNRYGEDMKFLMTGLDIRWCATQILSVIMRISDRATSNMIQREIVDSGLGAEEAFSCLLRWQEFLQDVSLEKAGWYFESSGVEKSDSFGEKMDSDEVHNLQSFGMAVTSSVFLESNPSSRTRELKLKGKPFVLTSVVKKSFEMVQLAVSQRWPVLLYGQAGTGKTALINRLAQNHGSRVLSIHMDEQTDGKTLIGSYVCAEQPGEFKWQPGSLTQALTSGLWVVLEDIDKAPTDVQSILLPLLEGATSFLTGNGEVVRVNEGFRLFSTVSCLRLDTSSSTSGRNSLSTLWRRVMVWSPSSQDLLNIVEAWYPELKDFAGELIVTYERVNQLAAAQFGTSVSFASASRFSLRDILKWCKRIVHLVFRGDGNALSAKILHGLIYQEAVDVFATFSSSVTTRKTIMTEIAKIWGIQSLDPVDKPVIKEMRSDLQIGRIFLQRTRMTFSPEKKNFVELCNSVCLLERIAASVKCNEPVLLVGETGTGKTTLVQNLAMRLGQRLTILNLSQQSDVADLLGGFKPMNVQFVCLPLYKEFESLFSSTFSLKENEGFLATLRKCVTDKNWSLLFTGFQMGVRKVTEIGKGESGLKRKRPLSEELLTAWGIFSLKLERARLQIINSDGMVFSFVEGAFVTALKNGDWILLDEINLAPPETLQRVIGVLEEESGSLCLAERGDVNYIYRHPNFRIFACMNPATDAGKRDLSFSVRSRFTEYFVDDVLEDEDLFLFVNQIMYGNHSDRELTSKLVRFYKAARKESEEKLQDSANQKPQYSLRSLHRALTYTIKASRKFGFQKALYDGFCMFFLVLLDVPSAKLMNQLILKHLLAGIVPPQVPFDKYLEFKNQISGDFLDDYVLTRSVKGHLTNLARAIFVCNSPVLLQGPTSSGKTSLVRYLALITGHEFVRINNHEHTDLQEYLGSYVTDASGKLVFQEGVLVKAVRHGYWIVLDELNLAPSDVLEALNRLLDDNRELYIPELCETIRAHPKFMLFATQNPPTFYGGRKMLSRAFRNRFVEIHVDEIPDDELCTILEARCKIPNSYAKKMVDVLKELQLRRQISKVFAGKHGFITPRDLFRWAYRFRTFGKSYEDLARDGYYLLAERLRDDVEKKVVQDVLEMQLRIKISKDDMYKQGLEDDRMVLSSENLGRITWTDSMRRLYFLVERCYRLREPVLLVGETGGGKTTVCQLLSLALGSKLHILNCHQYTETSDFLGGFYPIRERSGLSSDFRILCEQLMQSKAFKHFHGETTISLDINQASVIIEQVTSVLNSLASHPEVTRKELSSLEETKKKLVHLHQMWHTIFTWQDGPLVQAMKNGDLFLVDEISLADDSVLERLNSVLEPERKLSLAERGGSTLEEVTAHPNFFLLATMNPGGDFGKKELSPALRNRFTEIWVPPVDDLNELRSIALEKTLNRNIVDPMIKFWKWFNELQTGRMLTVRDLLSWIAFINDTESSLQPEVAFLHGAFLVLLDGLSLGTSFSKHEVEDLRKKCFSNLLEQLKDNKLSLNESDHLAIENYSGADPVRHDDTFSLSMGNDGHFGIHPFYIKRGDDFVEAVGFEFLAPTTRKNALRVLRAMQLAKPVLLEGSPGVGKTSLIVALGKFSGHSLVRINLSEQTDIMDLLGSDLPVESDEGMQFAWSDGILLQALKKGSWVLLDELNLAPQSVLEGLNAILDHRGEVFIPELGLTFKCPSSFRIFACQNPTYQGGGRKGLPKSFLNRFTKVYVDELVERDYLFICTSLYPSIPESLLSKLISFNTCLHEYTMVHHKFGQDGSPWEFNLRDVIRSCQIIEGAPDNSKLDCFLNAVYVQRMRTPADRREVVQLYEKVFGLKPFISPYPRVQLSPHCLIVGNTCIERSNYVQPSIVSSSSQLKILPGMRNNLEAVTQCVKYQWLILLIGPPSSGKTSLIRLLAQLSGNVLNELNLSSATDTSELLGCFEQYNAIRTYRFVIDRVERYMSEYCAIQMESSSGAFMKRKDLISRWLAFLSSTDYRSSLSSVSAYDENWRTRSFGSISLLFEIIEHIRLHLEKDLLPTDLDRMLKTIRKLQDDHAKNRSSVKFEWVTGSLIKAIENGEWIILENANLCNPTVLDRINSLVEQSGSITVNECGTVDGQPVVLRPHDKFRMFFTVNPSYGEVSRAMRNRGVEIYMMQPHWLLAETFDQTDFIDVKRFLVLSGVPGERLVHLMAKAHIYARREGARHGVSITNLELARWVQLFQRLITSGNQSLWSLQISWEHTYLSSLGEVEGKSIVDHALLSFLSMAKLNKFKSYVDCSLCLPGGWPAPLKLNDFVRYSKETSVKQNCMYLESLGAQLASKTFRIASGRCRLEYNLIAGSSPMTHLMDLKMLREIMFPEASNVMVNDGTMIYDSALANKRLLFAANWAIEQATESDLDMYLLWFDWFGSRLKRFCPFFYSFSNSLREERKHSIWVSVLHCRQELKAHSTMELESIPILSLELANLTASKSESYGKFLKNAIDCVGLLRHSYLQWNAESEFDFSAKTVLFKPLLQSLRKLEDKVLDILPKSASFDVLFRLYKNLLEDHILFWNGLVSEEFECLLIAWRSLGKDAVRLFEYCRREVENFQEESKALNTPFWSLHSQKSLLWLYGGHPFLPSSADIYRKQQQLLNLCESIWSVKMTLQEIAVDGSSIGLAVSSNPELRILAMQGFCLSECIMSEVEDDLHVIQQLEDMFQKLLIKFNHEKDKLQKNLGANCEAYLLEDSSPCCALSPDMLCRSSCLMIDTVPLNDHTSFYLDMRLLLVLSKVVMLDGEEVRSAISRSSGLLQPAMEFSLTFSSRPPADFSPHQKILWIHEAWASINDANAKFSSCVLEMWFRWHTSLWNHHLGIENPMGPDMLFQPVKTATLDKILKSSFLVRDYSVHSLKLRVASNNLWRSSSQVADSHGFLPLAARFLFQQIILAHKKSFEADTYSSMKSIFSSIQEKLDAQDDVNDMISMLKTTKHNVLESCISPQIEPLLNELYIQRSSTDSLHDLGCAWLRIGGLRYTLLICCDDIDPVVKNSLKYNVLTDKINLLQLEIEVQSECVRLAGCVPSLEADKKRKQLLEDLKTNRERLRRQIVFRAGPEKFKKLKNECGDASKDLVGTLLSLQEEIESLNNMEEMSNKLHHWQEKATAFIDRLSEEYSGYVDIIQPVQVAIYEMKLGLSLVHLSALRKQFLNKVKQDNIVMVLGTIYSFMRFPRCCRLESAFISDGWKTEVSPSKIEFHTNIEELDLNLLENLVTSATDANTDKSVSDMQLKAAIHHNMLFRVVQSIAEAHVVDNASFKLLVKIFDEFANLWMRMKVRVKTKAEIDASQYKFRPRAFKMEHVIEVNISALGISGDSDTLSEWQELVSEAESTEASKGGGEYEALDEDWNVMHESFLNDVVNIHNILFGSMDLLQDPGSVQVSDSDRLRSFMDSYELGIRMIKDLDGLLAASLDAKLLPEHVLRVCLEHEQKFNSSQKPAKSYNFYKDPNASLMAKMIEPLRSLQKRICALQSERDNLRPGLQKILDVIDMLLSIPLGTPLAKALSGLQFLLNRVWLLQETVSKFSISDQLDPILGLVSSWQKLEFESWPALLDEVQVRFNINACQLWFPLYSVLQHRNSAETNEDSQSTIQSLEDFMQTSNIGEFRKRLELLLAFHGQISTAIKQRSYSSGFHEDNLKILYNTFGFYVQFLPIIVEHLSSSRKSIEVELNRLLKLCRWERSEKYLTMENSKRTRQKFRQLIQKYSDVLEQPVVLILNELAQRGIKTLGVHGPNSLSEYFERNSRILGFLCNQSQFRDKERSTQSGSWRYKVDLAFQNLNLQTTAGFDFPYLFLKSTEGPPSFEGITSIISKCISSQSSPCVSQERHTIEEIGNFLIGCGEVWKSEKKSLRKRRQLSGLLKLLDDCGLSKHKSTFLEDQFRTNGPSRWFLQPSYVVQHLLMTEGRMASMELDVAALERVHGLPQEKIDTEWKTANEYFFKSIAAVGHLRQICLNFHKDFTLEQVNRSVSYLDHLIEIQQEQREAVYGFAESLECLRKCSSPLDNLFSGSPQTGADGIEYLFSDNQTIVFKTMWQQKELLDDLCSTLHEECLLLETVENSHSRNCQSIGASASRMRLSLQEFIPDCNKSKDLLNVYLLGHAGIQVTANVSLRPYGITKQMEDVVQQNFQLLRKLKEHIFALHNRDEDKESMKDRGIEDNLVKDVLYSRIEDILAKADLIAESFNSALKPKNLLNTEDPFHLGQPISEIEPGFVDALNETCGHIFNALLKVGSLSNIHGSSEESLGNISVWRALFDSEVANLQLKSLCDKLDKTIHSAGEVVNRHGNRRPNLCLVVEAYLKHLYSLLDLILTFSNHLLYDFLVLHRNVSIITHVLANIFASLFSQGFGVSTEDESDESGIDKSRDASGTGMGEGIGVKDVSEQINDEDQLIGIADKLMDEQDNLTNTPNENDKGIEMEQDFDGDTHSVGEESGDDEDDAGEDDQLDSAMGETGPNSEILDEKLWDKDDDTNQENPSDKHENYESGPSVKDDDPSSRELRGKEDNSTATDESGALDTNDSNQHGDENGKDGSDDDVEDMNIDKDEAFSESTGLKLDEPDKGTNEDIVMDEAENVDDQMEDDEGASQEGNDESPVHNNEGDDEGKTNSLDGGLDDAEPEQLTNNSDLDSYQQNDRDTDMLPPRRDATEAVTTDFGNDYNLSNGESSTKPIGGSHAAAFRDIPPEANWSNSNENGNDLAPVRGLPNESENEIAVSDSSKSGKRNDDKSNHLPQLEPSSSLKKEPNPFRSIGDALNGWKEKVNVSLDFEEENNEGVVDELVDETAADEYGFTTGLDKGTDQALGTASADQIDRNIEGKEPMDGDSGRMDQAADCAQMDIGEEHVEPQPIKGHAMNLQNKKANELLEVLQEEPSKSPSEIYSPHRGNMTDSLVSVGRSYMNDDIHQFGKLSVSDEDLGRAHNLEGLSSDMKDNSTSLWRKYELLTTRLSQELAEQLRLVMEPTLASKLQGDYKTGKRINMKMVIPFIASHYRRDKIWLRRTRPNKRNYQVVIAIDDSRSMSESHCGDVAIEALVTVCRAMSQLEVGSFAVASFGKKGNIRLLHDFDQPFNGEAGVKMLSSLTFTQENTIADEPVVDLLKYLNNLLDTAVANARLPSGHNPLQQLVLIIADGRFHEKENLKRYVRDLLSKKCMVAFLLLDSPQESIMDLTEASFQGGNVKFGKYMDSFPFPFYVVLRNIEALPHTLANLLRQWFELMQSSRE